MSALSDDLKYGARLLRRSPGFSLAAILALALGIGANTAIFSVVDAVLLARLPFADADRVVMVWEDASHQGFPRNTPAPANWVDWRKQNTVFTDVAAIRGRTASITGDGPPEQIFGRGVTGNLWTVLGVQPILGRVFTEDEEKAGEPLVVISYGLWQRRYAGDNSIIGRKILLSGSPFTVTAVMPRGFAFPNRTTDIWAPAAFTQAELARRGSHFLQCVARLKNGVTVQQAQAEMSLIMKRLEKEYPKTNEQIGAALVPIREQMVGDTRIILIALLCAAGCVLLIACANIGNLLMARGSERHREMAVRAALGAGGRRLIRQLLTESLLLALLGAVAGLGIAAAGMRVLEKLIPARMAAVALHLDTRLLGFTLAVSLATGLVFGALPALAGARLNLSDALKQGGRGSAGRRRGWLRDGLVLAQVSLALILLTAASLMMQTLYRLQHVDLGIRTDHLLTLQTFLPANRYPDHTSRVTFYNSVLDKVRVLPGVVSAGYTSDLPLTTIGNTNSYTVRGQTQQDAQFQDALFRVVTPEYFNTMGVHLREGRFFTDGDRDVAKPVLIVNETFADHHWPGQSALGKGIQINHHAPEDPWLEVVGVVKEVRERGIDIETKPVMYMPQAQAAREWPVPDSLAIRTSVEPLAISSAVRQVIWSVDRDQPISRLRTMDDIAGEGLADRRQTMTLLSIFAAVALILAIIGLYGVLSYMVLQRSREIAVRVAMGARPAQVVGMIAARGLSLTAGGLAIGTVGALATSRLIRTLLFHVPARDPWTLSSAALLLTSVALAACLVPARRASRIDPALALRND
ncbi:MAG TPA: ABC transporter permease [Bryobacteraceae bacterium]